MWSLCRSGVNAGIIKSSKESEYFHLQTENILDWLYQTLLCVICCVQILIHHQKLDTLHQDNLTT